MGMFIIDINVKGVNQVRTAFKLKNAQMVNTTINATHRVMDEIEKNANEIVYRDYKTYSHGHSTPPIEKSWVHEKGKYYSSYGYITRLRNDSEHACVVGSKSMISLNDTKSVEICSIKHGTKVLSKDGKLHTILATKNNLTVKNKPNLVIFNTEKSYKKDGTILTDDHLVLAWNNDAMYAYWEEIGNLKEGDYLIRKNKTPWNKGKGKISCCKNCGKKFKSGNPSRRKYCSINCYHENTSFNRNEGKHWTLTEEQCCKHIGKNNGAYIDGRAKKKYGYGWTESLRKKTKKRDNYTCQICKTHNDLVVHHIDNDKHNNTLDNLTTLCRSCHTIKHWRERDCELVKLDLDKFKPVKITMLKHVNSKEIFSHNNAKLYDLNVENENSFVVNGIVVHNSAVEFGVPHIIYPKNAMKLHLGNGVFKESVRGQDGKFYLTNAINMTDQYLDIFARELRGIIGV